MPLVYVTYKCTLWKLEKERSVSATEVAAFFNQTQKQRYLFVGFRTRKLRIWLIFLIKGVTGGFLSIPFVFFKKNDYIYNKKK